MKILVAYDSRFGNTEKVAKSIAKGFERGHKVKLVHIDDVWASDYGGIGLFVLGSPTHGGKPSEQTKEFIKKIPKGALEEVRVAAFDTRFAKDKHGVALRILMSVIGFAAAKIGRELKTKGGKLIGTEGFIVSSKDGPLQKGELARAERWAKGLVKA